MPEQRAEPPVLIISPDPDLSGPVAEHVERELGLACMVASNKNEAKQHIDNALVVISPEPLEEDLGCPVIAVPQRPLKLQDLLDDIANIRHNHRSGEIRLAGACSLSVRQKQLSHIPSGRGVTLTDKEVRLLQCLAEARGHVVPRDQLLKRVWGFGEMVDTHTLETHVYRLRGKFREVSGEDALIAATEGGYKLAME